MGEYLPLFTNHGFQMSVIIFLIGHQVHTFHPQTPKWCLLFLFLSLLTCRNLPIDSPQDYLKINGTWFTTQSSPTSTFTARFVFDYPFGLGYSALNVSLSPNDSLRTRQDYNFTWSVQGDSVYLTSIDTTTEQSFEARFLYEISPDTLLRSIAWESSDPTLIIPAMCFTKRLSL
jgi:hypothetical protein